MRQGGLLAGYDPGSLFCEMLRPGQEPHPALSLLLERLRQMPIDALRRRAADAERDLLERGITFTVDSDATAIDRILPFDLIPRVITAEEWRTLEAGVIQRVRALNLFLYDVYHDQKILADGVVPRALVLGNAGYSQAMVGFEPPFGTYVHVCGTDIIRDETGRFLVLEDNARTPSGVAYVVENRHMTLARAVGSDDRVECARGGRIRPSAAPRDDRDRTARRDGSRRWCCCRPASSTRRISSTCSWRARWACRWSRGRTCWSKTARSGCAPRRGSRRCTRSTGG